jgi:hydroxyethylthiazole kinase-like uncharacterized protein yjeF
MNELAAKMNELLSSAQMRAIEKSAIAAGHVSGLALMERAGEAVVAAVIGRLPLPRNGAPRRAMVLCGPGNNGGDGFVIARLLAGQGWQVEVYLCGEAQNLPEDARQNYHLWCGIGAVNSLAGLAGRIGELSAEGGECPDQPQLSLFVDALFGIGLGRVIPRAAAEIFAQIDALAPGRRPLRLAVDLPSGLGSDHGQIIWPIAEADHGGGWPEALVPVFTADMTVTFHRPKPGHLLAQGPVHSGELSVADIGLAPPASADVSVVQLIARPGADQIARLRKHSGQHKYDHGHALVLAGPPGAGGAGRLAARSALRVGAGLVTLAAPPAAMAENAARLDAVMLREIVDDQALFDYLRDPRLSALCLGPGLGQGARERGLLVTALRDGRPVVLDADAISLLAREPALLSELHPGCVLTPHGGEFARLCPDLAKLAAGRATGANFPSKIDLTRAAARHLGCSLLLKGADTVVAEASGRVAVHAATGARAAPWLATAGAGDVLAGLIAGLLARGFPPFEAACLASWLHVEAAQRFGPGLIADDLPEAMLPVLRALDL